MNFQVIAINETSYWNEQIVAHTGRIYGLYLVDLDRKVHCCEITPSYELYFIESVTEATISDELDMEIIDADMHYSDQVVYWHCHAVDRMAPEWFDPVSLVDIDEEDLGDWDRCNELMLEYVRCNQHVPRAVPMLVGA